jgi:hypothetical protein
MIRGQARSGLRPGSHYVRALAVLTATGGELFFPAATYFLSGPIDITSNNITLRGESPFGSRLAGSGAFDTIRVLGPLSKPLTAVHLKNLYFLGGGKTAGNSILIRYSGQCLIVDCQMEAPSSGVRLHSGTPLSSSASGSPGRPARTRMASGSPGIGDIQRPPFGAPTPVQKSQCSVALWVPQLPDLISTYLD